jgi:predicted ATPase/class 3 adenylate cyclase/tRNA A-37 threonylcarbamoyl transferase component Bud32
MKDQYQKYETLGFSVDHSLFKNEDHEVLKAIRNADGHLVVLKTIVTGQNDKRKLSKLSHEYAILKKLDHKSIVKPISIHQHAGEMFLVQNYCAGESLKAKIIKGNLSINDFLLISINICEALAYLHDQGYLHRDINSTNIVVNQNNDITLIDFDICALTQHQIIDAAQPEYLEGTLEYMSPEQTGRTSYAVTASSDLYSLGIVMYEMLTGKIPFTSTDPMEVIHFHLGKHPAQLSSIKPNLSPLIAQLVHTLMDKNPDARYQSAEGLIFDLQAIKEVTGNRGVDFNQFILKTEDKSGKLTKKQKIYGREKEINYLLNQLHETADKNSKLIMLSGYSGVGKSVIIKQLQQPVIQSGGVFITGKFEQFKKNIPYSALIEAIEEKIRNILSEGTKSIIFWKNKIEETLGQNTALIVEVIPSLELITGKKQSLAVLQPAEQEFRFKMVLLDFIFCFASTDSPLVIFFDDLQWADLPSINLIENIVTTHRSMAVTILGTYRSNEVDDLHPLYLSIKQLKKEGVEIKELHLDPLTEEVTCEIVADALNMYSAEQSAELGKYVYLKTNGNPFFINRFLLTIYEQKLIQFKPKTGWTWDISSIEKLDYTDNVLDLMSNQVSNLPDTTAHVLRSASIIGGIFSLEMLSSLLNQSSQQTYIQLLPAIKDGFILPLDLNYRLVYLPNSENKTYEEQEDSYFKFLHDRVHQAVYRQVGDEEKKNKHLSIGRLLTSGIYVSKLNDLVFEITSHYSECLDLVVDDAERIKFANIFALGGKKAKDSASYDVAIDLLEKGRSLLPDNSWDSNYDLTFNIISDLGLCHSLAGNHDKADSIFNLLLDHAETKFEKLNIYYTQSSLYYKIGNATKSLQIGREAMKMYGITFPTNKKWITMTAYFQLIKYLILFSTKYRSKESIFSIKECHDEEEKAITNYMIDISTSAYVLNQELMMIVVLRIIGQFLKKGFTDGTLWGFAGFSTIVYSALGLSKLGFKLWDITTELHNRVESPIIKSKVAYSISSFYKHWRFPNKLHAEDMMHIFKSSYAGGDQIWAGLSIANQLWEQSIIGLPLDQVLNDATKGKAYLIRTKTSSGLNLMMPQWHFVNCLLGNSSQLGRWELDEVLELNNPDQQLNLTEKAYLFTSKIPLFYYFKQWDEGLNWIDEGEKYQANNLGTNLIAEWKFYSALIISNTYKTLEPKRQRKFFNHFRQSLKDFKRWAEDCPANFEAQNLILQAELQTMQNSLGTSIKLYEQAIQSAHQFGLIHLEAIANEQASLLMNNSGLAKQSSHYIKDAMVLYQKWNAYAKCTHLGEMYPTVFHNLKSPTSVDNESDSRAFNQTLDLGSIIKASQALTSQLKVNELIKKLLSITIENAGAERGLFIIPKSNELFIKAEGKTNSIDIQLYDNKKVEDNINLPQSIVNLSWQTQDFIYASDALEDVRFNNDPFVLNNQLKSIACIPVSNKGKKIGLIYLENKSIKGLFNEAKKELLSILTSQIAISYENAQLYENMEEEVQERTKELELEKANAVYERGISEKLLLNILPKEIAHELKYTGKSEAKLYDRVSVLFTDFVDFTQTSEKLSPHDLVSELNKCFQSFDLIMDKHDLEKIKTIGDAYLAVGGLPIEVPDHAKKTVDAALDILAWVKDPSNKCLFDIRIGVHTGPVIAGIVGYKKYVYDIWGDTVNTASRMESSSITGKINISSETHKEINNYYICSHRGKITAKHKGEIDMYFVESIKQ